MSSFQRSSSVLSAPGRPSKRVAAPASATSPASIARKIFLVKYGLQLAPGCIQWLERFVEHFGIQDEQEITDTFEHLVRGVVGTGSGLGQLTPLHARAESRAPRADPHRSRYLDGPSKITEDLLEETYEKLRVSAEQPDDANGDDLDPSNYLKLINAFDMPLWRWDDNRAGFER